MKKRTSIVLLLVATMFLLAGCRGSKDPDDTETNMIPSTDESESIMPEDTQTELGFQEYEITLMATGDNLMHMGAVNAGIKEDGTFDYSHLFEGISDFLQVADIKVTNQETILGGNHLGFSGYPNFNSPTEWGDALVEAGYNIVLQASNHSADKGLEGLLNCVEFWETYPEVLMVGIHEEAAESHEIPLLTIGDVTFAILNYTYSPNRDIIPEDIRGRLDMLCYWDRTTGLLDLETLDNQVLLDIERAEELADVVIVFPHWGNEYNTSPSYFQELFAKQMTEAGADLIIGTHPHVIQPIEWIESDNGNRALCYYSTGNYVSTQQHPLRMLEAMAWVTFRVTEEGVYICEEKTGAVPLVCHYKSGPVRVEYVYLLEDYTEELAASHGIKEYGGVDMILGDLWTWTDQVLGEWVFSADDILSRTSE